MKLIKKLGYFARRLIALCSATACLLTSSLVASDVVDVKALIYSRTAAELQWNRLSSELVQIDYNGARVATFDANSYFTDQLDPSVSHLFQLRTLRADGSLSEPVDITFDTDEFTLPIKEIRVDNSILSDESGLPDLSEVRLLAYSNTAVELFWTRLGSIFTTVEVIHNGVSLGITGNSSLYLTGLDSTLIHEFLLRPVRESGLEQDWFSISINLQEFTGDIHQIVATRIDEPSAPSASDAPTAQEPVIDPLQEPELPIVTVLPSPPPPPAAPQNSVIAEAAPTLAEESIAVLAPANDDAAAPPTSVAAIQANDCVVRSLSDLHSCIDSAQGLDRINIQNDLACTHSSCCPTGGALLRFNNVANLTIEGNGHKLVRSGGHRQCSLLDVTQSENLTLNNWTLDDDVSVEPCLVGDECPRMLHIRTSSDVTLNQVNVLNGKGYVIYVQQVNGFNFLNSSLSNSGVLGLYVGHSDQASSNVRIQHSTFNDNQTNALALLGVTGSSVSDNIVSNNVFRRNHWRGQWAVEPRFGTGFTGGGQVYIAQASGLTISDNLIEDGYCENCFVQQFFGSGVSGIELAMPGRNSVTKTLITNNIVNNHDAWGIFVNEGSSLDGSVEIRNNRLTNNTVGLKPASTSTSGNSISNR